jgi:hypothetical protein
VAANVSAMGILDWAALLFATSIAALAVVGELKVRYVLSQILSPGYPAQFVLSTLG